MEAGLECLGGSYTDKILVSNSSKARDLHTIPQNIVDDTKNFPREGRSREIKDQVVQKN